MQIYTENFDNCTEGNFMTYILKSLFRSVCDIKLRHRNTIDSFDVTNCSFVLGRV